MSKKMILAGCGLLGLAVFSGAQTMKVFHKGGNPVLFPTASVDSVIFIPASSSSILSSSSNTSTSSSSIVMSSSSYTDLVVTPINEADWNAITLSLNVTNASTLPNLYVEVRGEGIQDVARFALTKSGDSFSGKAYTPKLTTPLNSPWKLNLVSSKTLYGVDTAIAGQVSTSVSLNAENINLPTWQAGADLIDSRETPSKTYKTVWIGNQRWMAQNLNYGTQVLGIINQADDAKVEKYCYNNVEDSCTKYGGLYQWSEVMNYPNTCNSTDCAWRILSVNQGICPKGWHVPSDAEWSTLTSQLGSWSGTFLKSTTGWTGTPGNGTDIFGFSALPAGGKSSDGSFDYLGSYANFWSASRSGAYSAWYHDLGGGRAGVYSNSFLYDLSYGFSVRCLQD